MVIINQARRIEGKVVQLGKYELGKTLGEGNFGKVKLARDTDCGNYFAVKILEKNKIVDLNNTDQVCVSFFNLFILENNFLLCLICETLCSCIYYGLLEFWINIRIKYVNLQLCFILFHKKIEKLSLF